MKKIYLYPFLVLLICISACRKDNKFTPLSISPGARTYSSNQIRNYFGLMCTITKSTAGFFPTQAARAYGYLGITAYESVRNGIPGASSLYGQINGLTAIPSINSGMEYNWAISSNAALAQMMRDMFGASLSATLTNKVDSTETANLATLSTGVSQDIVTRSIQYGKDVTAAVYTASMTDGGDKSYLNPFSLPYTVPVCPSCWVPTNPAVPNPLSPNWANNRPFILADVSSVTPAPPTDFSTDPSSAFYANAMAVYNQVKNNTADQVEISKYWSDDPFNTCTPAGHTFNIMIQLLKENSATLEKASVAFAKLSIAENDAFISCWKGKYQYNRIRPVSYIKKNIDATFATIIGTPPFPAYCGGHSFESGAGSMIFINMFTDGSGNYNYTDYSQVQYGFAPRQYTNFTAMALECSNSRYYAGIHFNEDNLAGLKGGQMVGGNVNTLIKWPSSLK